MRNDDPDDHGLRRGPQPRPGLHPPRRRGARPGRRAQRRDENSSALLDDAPRRLTACLEGRAPHEDPHVAAWRDMYAAFGAKPSRTRNSAEALAGRALTDAGLPRINRLVDLCDAISVPHLNPCRRRGHRPHQGSHEAGALHRPGGVPHGRRRRDGHRAPGARGGRPVRRRIRHLQALEPASGHAHPPHRGVGRRRLPAGGARSARPRRSPGPRPPSSPSTSRR